MSGYVSKYDYWFPSKAWMVAYCRIHNQVFIYKKASGSKRQVETSGQKTCPHLTRTWCGIVTLGPLK